MSRKFKEKEITTSLQAHSIQETNNQRVTLQQCGMSTARARFSTAEHPHGETPWRPQKGQLCRHRHGTILMITMTYMVSPHLHK